MLTMGQYVYSGFSLFTIPLDLLLEYYLLTIFFFHALHYNYSSFFFSGTDLLERKRTL